MKEYARRHYDAVRSIAPECMVLLKSDGTFPLEKPGKIALYGNGARRTFKGGRGSADMYVRWYPSVEEGLERAGFTITTKAWLDAYEQARAAAIPAFRDWLKEKIVKDGMRLLMENFSIMMPEPDYDLPLNGEGDTAVYVLNRMCGESADRLDVPGDYRLSRTEIRDILQLQKQYPRFLLVLNVGCVVDLSPVAEEVGNILLLSQTGSAIGDAFADALLGKAYPSGKLAATWMSNDEAYQVGEFGNTDDTRYREGIYVGYRFADSVGQVPLFPFGFGLGYTSFDLHEENVRLDGTEVVILVQVTNTGSRPGKEVAQAYVSIPSGRLDQPAQVLSAFAKTRELAAGEQQTVTLRFDLASLASADSKQHLRVLESGDYILRIGNSSRSTTVAAVIRLNGETVIEHIHAIGGETDFTDWQPSPAQRAAASTLFEGGDENTPLLTVNGADFAEIQHHMPALDPDALAIAKSLSDEDICYFCTGDFVGEGSKSVVGDAALTVVGAAGENTGRFRSLGVENLVQADGATGLRLPLVIGEDENSTFVVDEKGPYEYLTEMEDKLGLLPESMLKLLRAMYPDVGKKRTAAVTHEQETTALPIPTAIAQSWSEEVAAACADITSEELKLFGVDIWLAPALNIQRHPLLGRTFEYFSEDPLISGKMAAAMVKAIQRHPGLSATIKHFICNNQEHYRFRTSSMVNERALRDIYARGFEIAVKESQPHCLMSSYNLLNGVHTSERYDLLENLLREEWGFEGLVMSDYNGGDQTPVDQTSKYRKFASAPSVKAGNDLMMPGGIEHYENILRALKGEDPECCLTRDEVERSAARGIALAWKLKGKPKA